MPDLRKGYDELAADLGAVSARAPYASIWQHASGSIYEVVGAALREDGIVPGVLYRPVEDDRVWWWRPAEEFFARFTLVPEVGGPDD